ncbi:MAG: hypothetical protein KDB82_06130 [Planctomycetes bacterium]|nr:hypothetical protein [Planctomycetota bacterium]
MAMEYQVEVDGETYNVRFFERDGQLHVAHAGGTYPVHVSTPLRSKVQLAQMNGKPQRFGYHRGKESTDIVLDGIVYSAEVKETEHVRLAAVAKRKGGGGASDVKAPMPGMVIAINVKVGDEVKKNQSLLSLHAMKLENDIRAPREGVVKEIAVKPNDVLEKGALMIKLGPLPEKDS